MAAAQTVKPAAPALRKICDILAALAELPVGPGIIPRDLGSLRPDRGIASLALAFGLPI
jgi:hypothetical protein